MTDEQIAKQIANSVFALEHRGRESLTAAITEALRAEREAMRKVESERDEARDLVAEANNSLFGSHGYFHSLDGGSFNPRHLSDAIENIKRLVHAKRAIAEKAEAEVKRLRDGLMAAVYEATHLSPEEEDGSHWAKMSKQWLDNARNLLAKGETP